MIELISDPMIQSPLQFFSPRMFQDAFASERRKAKMLNFSIAYGKTPVGLGRDWKVLEYEQVGGTCIHNDLVAQGTINFESLFLRFLSRKQRKRLIYGTAIEKKCLPGKKNVNRRPVINSLYAHC